LGWAVPAIMYIRTRNKTLLEADRVMTAAHLAFWFKTKVLKQKVKPKPLTYEGGSLVQLEATGRGIDSQTLMARTVRARNLEASAGYNLFRELLYHAIHNRATEVTIEFGQETSKFQYQIDGVFHPVEDAFKRPWTREASDCVAETIKELIGGKPKDRRARQAGMIKILYDKNKKGKPYSCEAQVMTAGTQTGEMCKVVFKMPGASFKTLDELGVYEDRQDLMRELINSEHGFVVLASAPHQGLKTLTTVAFNTADRFTRDFSTVEDSQRPYETIENIALTSYDSSKGETPMNVLPDVFFKEPKVLLIRDIGTVDAWNLCCEEVKNDRLIITTIRGKDCIAALIEILKLGVDKQLLADSLTAFIAQKLVRRLCEECKEEIKPDPRVIKALGLDPKTEKIYRKHTHEPVEPGERDFYVPCETCRDIGYQGRVAVFDCLKVDDEMRQIIASDADLATKEKMLRTRAMKSGQRGYLVDAARLVAEGITSFDEIVRIMK
ncbi:MAG: hypothetical protein HUK22_03610, partial [Thermoguttaceae bacterium]|nr:hypothetical protein [Thermoguttaceae bacterium]